MSILEFVCLGGENPDIVDAFAPLMPQELAPRVKSGELMALGALLAEYPNGVLVFSLEGERARILSLYVDEYDRRHGTGSELVEELQDRLRAMGGVYSIELCLPGKCDEGIKKFLTYCGFETETGEGSEAVVPLSALKALALPKPKLAAVPGDKLDDTILRTLEARLKAEGRYFLEGSLTEPPVKRELCRFAAEKGVVTAAAIVTGDEPLCLAYLFGENSAALGAVLYDAREAVLDKYPKDASLYIDAASENGERLAKRLLGEDKLLARKIARKPI